MFSFRKPKCPIDDDWRQWVDNRMQWLAEQFGRTALQDMTVVTPTTDYFPDPYEQTESCLDKLFDRMCEYMHVDRSRVTLLYYEENSSTGERTSALNEYHASTAGLYVESEGMFHVSLNVDILQEPLIVAATMAHELGHIHLLGDRRLSDDEEDHEPVTDLLTVFMGLGVLTANAALQDRNYRVGNVESWIVGRNGYLTMPTYGYALAWFATQRGECNPVWVKHLRLDVRTAFKAGVKFLTSL